MLSGATRSFVPLACTLEYTDGFLQPGSDKLLTLCYYTVWDFTSTDGLPLVLNTVMTICLTCLLSSVIGLRFMRRELILSPEPAEQTSLSNTTSQQKASRIVEIPVTEVSDSPVSEAALCLSRHLT